MLVTGIYILLQIGIQLYALEKAILGLYSPKIVLHMFVFRITDLQGWPFSSLGPSLRKVCRK